MIRTLLRLPRFCRTWKHSLEPELKDASCRYDPTTIVSEMSETLFTDEGSIVL